MRMQAERSHLHQQCVFRGLHGQLRGGPINPNAFYPETKRYSQDNVRLGTNWHDPLLSSGDDGPTRRLENPDSNECSN